MSRIADGVFDKTQTSQPYNLEVAQNWIERFIAGTVTTKGGLTVVNTTAGDTGKGFFVAVDQQNLTTGMRQGALNVTITRASTSAMTAWDGNPDTAIKVISRNNATNGITQNGVRALDIQARNDGTNAWVKTMELNARNSSGKNTVDMVGLHIRMEVYGQVDDNITALDIEMSAENDTSSPKKTAILIRNTDGSGMTVVANVIELTNTSTNGFGAFLNMDGLTAANGTIVSTSGTAASTFAARLRVITPNGSAGWINIYSTSNEA